MGFRRIVQIGIVVSNIEETSEKWAKLLGLEPQPIIETEDWKHTQMTFRGNPSPGKAKLTFFRLENIVIELIQPIGGPSTWSNFLEKHGCGIHHIAFTTDDVNESTRVLLDLGAVEEQKGLFKGGGYVYLDARESLGAILELLYYRRD
ncbi:MAG: VOC family protein [Candidatus Bathyarchaeia archaeon]|nr:VOC family protein [Candidatus Bathyarchaeota archaeon]